MLQIGSKYILNGRRIQSKLNLNKKALKKKCLSSSFNQSLKLLRTNNSNLNDRSDWQRFKCVVAYDGTSMYYFYFFLLLKCMQSIDYSGWQSQPHRQTIQDVIEHRLQSYFHFRVVVIGSGRTDSGVHSIRQTFHFDAPFKGKYY